MRYYTGENFSRLLDFLAPTANGNLNFKAEVQHPIPYETLTQRYVVNVSVAEAARSTVAHQELITSQCSSRRPASCTGSNSGCNAWPSTDEFRQTRGQSG